METFVKDLIFFIMTKSNDLRYPVKQTPTNANNLDNLIKEKVSFMKRRFHNHEYKQYFYTVLNKYSNEDDVYCAKLQILRILVDLFPIINGLHSDNIYDIENIFFPKLLEIHHQEM
jgi:hypothetical protein